MPKPFLLVTTVLTVILMTLVACTGATSAPEPKENPDPVSIAATSALPANTPTPEATETPTSTPSPAPSERSTDVPKATPPAPPSPPTPEVLIPLDIQDPQALLAALSDSELACIGDPEGLAWTLAGPGTAAREVQAELFGCLEDETLTRLFLLGFVPGTGTPGKETMLSPETSQCVRAAFEVIDPRAVMTAGVEGDPGRAMAGSMAAFMVTAACLNDAEWEQAGPEMGMSPEDREAGQCIMEALGGPAEMAAAMTAAQEGDFADLAEAGERCGLDLGPVPGQMPTDPPEAPTPGPLPTQVNQAPSQEQDIPALTDDQVTKMSEVISSHPLLTVMLQGGYTINDYGPWVAGDRTFIGAIAEIFLTTPTDYQGSLPMVGFEPAEDGSKEYLSGTLNITASGIKRLVVLVDIAEEVVVGIEIGESDTLTLSADGE